MIFFLMFVNFGRKQLINLNSLKIRTVVLRTGIVLSKEGGALEKMTTPIITSIGNGKAVYAMDSYR